PPHRSRSRMSRNPLQSLRQCGPSAPCRRSPRGAWRACRMPLRRCPRPRHPRGSWAPRLGLAGLLFHSSASFRNLIHAQRKMIKGNGHVIVEESPQPFLNLSVVIRPHNLRGTGDRSHDLTVVDDLGAALEDAYRLAQHRLEVILLPVNHDIREGISRQPPVIAQTQTARLPTAGHDRDLAQRILTLEFSEHRRLPRGRVDRTKTLLPAPPAH